MFLLPISFLFNGNDKNDAISEKVTQSIHMVDRSVAIYKGKGDNTKWHESSFASMVKLQVAHERESERLEKSDERETHDVYCWPG